MEEYLDILDENGNLTGEKASISESHKKGYWHRTVHVWIVNSKKEILFQKRSPNIISHPNLWWLSAGGHMVAGDGSIETARKETKELDAF